MLEKQVNRAPAAYQIDHPADCALTSVCRDQPQDLLEQFLRHRDLGPALTAIASNEVTIMFAALPSATPFVLSKRIKPIVVTSPKRAAALPDVPTVADAGVAGLQVMEWYGVLAPASTPPAIVNKLRDEIVRIIRKPEVASRFVELGADPVGNTPAKFALQIESDIAIWAKVVKDSGIRAD